MDWLTLSLAVSLAGILGYSAYLWTVDRRRAFAFLAEELAAMMFFTALAYFVLDPSILVGGSLEDFSISLAINRTVSLRNQFYQLHVSIVQVTEGVVVVDVVVSVAAAVLTAGAAIPILQAFNTGLQAVLGTMEGAATLAGTAFMLLQHLYWLLLIGKALAFLVPPLGGMLVVPRARKVALSGLAVVFVLAVLLPYAVNVSYRSAAAPELKTSLPRNFGRIRFTVRDVGGLPVTNVPVAVLMMDANHSVYVVRVVDGSVKLLPPGNYTVAKILVYWTGLWVPPCCANSGGSSGGFCQSCPAYPSQFYVRNSSTVSVGVTLPFHLIPGGGGAAGETVGYVNTIGPDAQRLEPTLSTGKAVYVLEPRGDKTYYVWFRAGSYSVEFPNQSVLAEKDPVTNVTRCWQLHYRVSDSEPWWLGRVDTSHLREMYNTYTAWWNRTRNAVPPTYWNLLEPGELEIHQPAGLVLKIWFTKGPCRCNETVARRNRGKNALVVINGTPFSWDDSNTRYLSYVGLWSQVLEAGSEVRGLVPTLQVAISMLYNIYVFVVLGGLAFGGLLGVAGYTLPGIVQGYFRQGIRRSFVTLPGLYRQARFVRAKLDERKAVVLPRKRLAFELRRIDATYGWSRRRKALEKTKAVARHALPETLNIAGERPAPGLIHVAMNIYDWWVEHRTGWLRETTRGHYYLERFYRAVRWTPLHLEEPIYRRLAEIFSFRRKTEARARVGLDEIIKRWPGFEAEIAPLYARHARRTLERVVAFIEYYKGWPRKEGIGFAEALDKHIRTIGDDEIKDMLRDLNGVLEKLGGADNLQTVSNLVNEFYTHIHPHISAIMAREGLPDHNAVLHAALEGALAELAGTDTRGLLALRALQGDQRALRYLSLTDWIYASRPEAFGVELERDELAKLALLAYAGDREALEALLGRLSEAEQGLKSFFADKSLEELVELAYIHEMKVTGDLAGELIRQGLTAGLVNEAPLYRLVDAGVLPKEALGADPVEVIQMVNEVDVKSLDPRARRLVEAVRDEFFLLPDWIYKMEDVATIAAFEAAALGLAPPLVETLVSLESGRGIIDVFNNAYPTGELARRLEEVEEGFRGMVDYLESLKPGEVPSAFGVLWDALKAKISAFGEEAESVKRDVEALYQYRLALSARLNDLYWIVREALEKYG